MEQKFQEAIAQVFQRWTTLALAVDQGHGSEVKKALLRLGWPQLDCQRQAIAGDGAWLATDLQV